MTDICSLCDLPASPGVIAPDVEGRFCCRGCMDVARSLGDADLAAEDVRARTERESPEVTADDDHAEAFIAVEGMHCTTCEAFGALQGEETDGLGHCSPASPSSGWPTRV